MGDATKDNRPRRTPRAWVLAGSCVLWCAGCVMGQVTMPPMEPARASPPAVPSGARADAERDGAAEAAARADGLPADLSPLEVLRVRSGRVMARAQCAGTRRLVYATTWLPGVDPRRVYAVRDQRPAGTPEGPVRWVSQRQFDVLPTDVQQAADGAIVSAEGYLSAMAGDPLIDIVALDRLCAPLEAARADGQAPPATDGAWGGLRVLDLNATSPMRARLLASRGAHVTAILPDGFYAAVYDDPPLHGEVPIAGLDAEGKAPGTLGFAVGDWAEDVALRERVRVASDATGATGYDLVLARNVLTMDDDRVQSGQAAEELAALVRPGGWVLVWSVCPVRATGGFAAPACADVRPTLEAGDLESAGFRVLVLGEDVGGPLRELAEVLGWGSGPDAIDVQGVRGFVTIARRNAP